MKIAIDIVSTMALRGKNAPCGSGPASRGRCPGVPAGHAAGEPIRNRCGRTKLGHAAGAELAEPVALGHRRLAREVARLGVAAGAALRAARVEGAVAAVAQHQELLVVLLAAHAARVVAHLHGRHCLQSRLQSAALGRLREKLQRRGVDHARYAPAA
ncbi:hypothetical protein ON010_g14809 [Phytophthora cinnamomi]|nr:hypothetical protein ON010_g14809 [Phytophthora cinnamomi]